MVPSLDYSASLAAYTTIPAPVDTTPPVITLLGTNPQTVTQASSSPQSMHSWLLRLAAALMLHLLSTKPPLDTVGSTTPQRCVPHSVVPLQGQAYVDSGATAKDNVDPIVSNIIITGAVNNMVVSLQQSCQTLDLPHLWSWSCC